MLNWNSSKMSWHHNNWASTVQQVRGKWPCCILKRIELVKVEEEYQPVVRAARILLSKLTSVTAVPPTKKAFTCKGREGSFALLLWEVPFETGGKGMNVEKYRQAHTSRCGGRRRGTDGEGQGWCPSRAQPHLPPWRCTRLWPTFLHLWLQTQVALAVTVSSFAAEGVLWLCPKEWCTPDYIIGKSNRNTNPNRSILRSIELDV